jgi:hypothetical protein
LRLEHFHADWKSRSDVRPMELLAKFELECFTTVEFPHPTPHLCLIFDGFQDGKD